MKVRSNVRVHQFSDNSGILFYNTLSEESTIVSSECCDIETCADGVAEIKIKNMSNDVMEQLVRKRFIER